MEIPEIFEDKIKIEPKVISIESLFNNPEKVKKTNYQPFYQRNYVWDDEKATYFIESILLGTEIPPLIFFRNADRVEVIDGRQRYQTILRFINDEFKIKLNGLQKLDNIGIANKLFRDLDPHLQDLFWDTKLRIIEFSFHSRKDIDDNTEEIVKKEIFKRYNSGITPLKSTELDKASYFNDDLNSFFKKKILEDRIILRNLTHLLHFEKSNNEKLLKKVRQLLVQHLIPIKYYAVKKDTIIAKFYELQFSSIDEIEIEKTYTSFIEKVNLIYKVYNILNEKKTPYNRLITECLFWAFSILETEGFQLAQLTIETLNKLSNYIDENIEAFELIRSSFYQEIYNRYRVISIFFKDEYSLDFNIYLHYNEDFKLLNKVEITSDEQRISFDELRINKPEPSSTAIIDICRLMERQRFLIRPPYQRDEVINTKKSSAIIESILLGIKLPPIFVFKRKDGVSEVLDGQQRLLSILGFINKSYLDENNRISYSAKNNYKLSLKGNILKKLDGKRFDNLSIEQKEKIKNFDLWIIEIDFKNNKNFEPIDLFIRLNSKPYPIKEDTFEMWNSYISRDIITTIKSIYGNHSSWFYIRKNNSRMENENIFTALAYLQYTYNRAKKASDFLPKDVDVYKVVNRINFRVKSKNEITKVLEDVNLKDDFINALNDLEFNFIRKLRLLLSNNYNDTISTINKNLDEIFIIEKGRRTQQAFYALWYFLYDMPIDVIEYEKIEIRQGLKSLFKDMIEIESKEIFDKNVTLFKSKFKNENKKLFEKKLSSLNDYALLGEISIFTSGITLDDKNKSVISNNGNFPYLTSGDFSHFYLDKKKLEYLNEDVEFSLKDFYTSKNKIIVRRLIHHSSKLNLAFYNDNLAFSTNYIGIVINRIGFNTKFVLSILSSQYSNSNLNKNLSQINGLKNLSINDLKSIEIPIIPIDAQKPFVQICDYIIHGSDDLQSTIFFERLIDAMVYEIFFPAQIKINNADVLKYLDMLEDIVDSDSETNKKIIEKVYKELSAPKHPISSALLKLLNIKEINSIEGRK